MARKIVRRPRRVARKPRIARRRFRPARDVPDIASCSVKRTITTPDTPDGRFRTNDMYQLRNVDLASYDRAVQIAAGYQHFRIKKVTLTLKPTYDTYQSTNVPGNTSRPNLYYMIDKSGSLPINVTLEALKQMGAKAHRFDEKPVSISWRPSVLTGDTTAPGVLFSAQYRVSPWLSTSAAPLGAAWTPSSVDHLGIFFYVEQLFAFEGGSQYTAELEVQFQFKKPLMPQVGSVPAKSVSVAMLDDSEDGVVGEPTNVGPNPIGV